MHDLQQVVLLIRLPSLFLEMGKLNLKLKALLKIHLLLVKVI